mmetsp:Transcript_111813/g.167426  ORF Transcript_111813/g.167426 Transcript_111813/m.167426 type:complete len:216 (-) Transcript_111813:155-802(-)
MHAGSVGTVEFQAIGQHRSIFQSEVYSFARSAHFFVEFDRTGIAGTVFEANALLVGLEEFVTRKRGVVIVRVDFGSNHNFGASGKVGVEAILCREDAFESTSSRDNVKAATVTYVFAIVWRRGIAEAPELVDCVTRVNNIVGGLQISHLFVCRGVHAQTTKSAVVHFHTVLADPTRKDANIRIRGSGVTFHISRSRSGTRVFQELTRLDTQPLQG